MNISLLGILLLVVFLIHTSCSQEGYTNNNNSKIKTRYAVNFKYNPKTGRRLLSKQAKRGTCIFPFKNKKHTDPLQFDCVKGKDGSSWCATEIKPNLLKEEWGYCVPEGMTEEEYNRMYEN